MPCRERAIRLLSYIGPVDCDRICQGKTPPNGSRKHLIKTDNRINIENLWNTTQLCSNYRFCFVMEHNNKNPAHATKEVLMIFLGAVYQFIMVQRAFLIFFND